MTTVGFIGSGKIGSTLARLALAAGYDVVMSNSRGPQTLTELVDQLGAGARAGTAAQAAEAGDLVVVSVPQKSYRSVPVEPLAGKTVIDTNNYYPQRDGVVAELADGSTTSSELLQRHLPAAHVVKVFNNIMFTHLQTLARPAGAAERTSLPIAGDDPGAKAAVAAFLDAIGFDAVDAGPLSEGWRYQSDAETAAYGAVYFRDATAADRATDPGQPVDAGTLRSALAEARRQPTA
jgi:predicted dinucleotide-binding enzyme